MAGNPVDITAAPHQEVQENQFTLRTDDVEAVRQQDQNTNGHIASLGQGGNNGYGTAQSRSQPKPSLPASAATRALAPDLLRGWLMVLQAIDHAAVCMNAWGHGQAVVSEAASKVMTRWNITTGFVARLFTHLCAPGFMFLLGMGVVYFCRSRSKLGWSWWKMSRHFWIRAIVLILVNQALGIMFIGFKFWIINVILLALAFVYVIIGHLWLVMRWTEGQLTDVIVKVLPNSSRRDSEQTSPLLPNDFSSSVTQPQIRDRAAKISFHVHNVFIFVFSIISMWWNIWLDPTHGYCTASSTPPTTSSGNLLYEFFFHSVSTPRIASGFPPLAWLFPALIGFLYARITLSSGKTKPLTINLGNLAVGLTLFVLFVLTRLFHFGNLDESCLHMPEHAGPNKNQHLASAKSFFYLTKYPPSPAFFFYTMSINFTFLSIFGFLATLDVTNIHNFLSSVTKRLTTKKSKPTPPDNTSTDTTTATLTRNKPKDTQSNHGNGNGNGSITTIFPFNMLLVFGQSALFFYALHMAVYMGLGRLAVSIFGHELDFDNPMTPGHKAIGLGNGVVFWSTWVAGLAVLWPACRVFARFKAGKGVDSVWRFF